MKIKIPYRYNKYETEFKDNENKYIISNEILKDDKLIIYLQCNTMWDLNNTYGLVWVTKLIKKI